METVNKQIAVREVFEQLLAGMKEQARALAVARYRRITARITRPISSDEMLKEVFGYTSLISIWPPDYNYVTSHFCTSERSMKYRHGLGYILKGEPDLTNAIAAKANDDVEQMFQQFIAKQTAKTDGIIKGRAVKVQGHIINGSLQCELTFNMADGSRFRMQTQIVWKVSHLGNEFWQFPTTFHDAYTADGIRISPASEKNLKARL